MKRRVTGLIKWTTLGLSAAFAVLVAISLFALTTETGARITIQAAASRLPLDLGLGRVQGSLRGPLLLTDVSVTTPNLELQVERLTLDWRPFSLLARRLHLDSARLSGVHARIKQDTLKARTPALADTVTTPAGDQQSIRLPLTIVFERFQIDDGLLSLSGSVSVDSISLTASGTDEDYRVDVTASLVAPRVGRTQMEASGQGNLSGFRVEDLRAAALDGEVRGGAALSWRPQVEWQAMLRADSLVPARLTPNPADWPGHISLRAEIEGSLADGRLEVDARVDTLYGMLRDQPVTGVIRSRLADSVYSVDRFDLAWGPVRSTASGIIASDRLDLTFDIRAPNLAAVLPRSSGSMSASGRIGGSPSTPVIRATARANTVVLDQFRLRRADARVDVDWQDRGRNEIHVTIDDLAYSDQTVDSLLIDVTGIRRTHRVTAAVSSQEGDIRLMASGGFSEWTWSGKIENLEIESGNAGLWRIDEAASLTASKTAFALEELCMAAAEGDVCIGGMWESQAGWRLGSTMNHLPLTLFRPFLPEMVTVSGTVSGTLNAMGNDRVPESAQLDLRPSSGSVDYIFRDTVRTLTYRDAHATVNVQRDSLHGDLNLLVTEDGRSDFGNLSVQVMVSSVGAIGDRIAKDGFIKALTGDWSINSTIEQVPLSLIAPFLPDSVTVDGAVTGQLDITGSAARPEQVELQIDPSAGSVRYALGDSAHAINYRDLQLRVNSEGDSLRGSFNTQLADAEGADLGSLSADVQISSLADAIDRASRDGMINAFPQEWRASSSLEGIQFALLQPFLPRQLTLEGTVSGHLEVAGSEKTPQQMELELRPSPGSVAFAPGDTIDLVTYRELHLSAKSMGDSLHGSLTLQIAKGDSQDFGSVEADVGFPSLAELFTEVSEEGHAALQDDWRLNARIEQVPLALFDPFLPGGATLAGSLDGTLEASVATDGTLSGELALEPRSATSHRTFGGATHTVRLTNTRANAHASIDGLRGELSFAVARPNSPAQGTISASIALPEFTRLDQSVQSQPLDARVVANMNLALLDELFDDFSGSTGRFEVDLTAGNTVAETQFAGHYRLQGQTHVIPLGIDLRDIDISASDNPEGVLQIEGSVSSGNGTITVAGTSPAIPTPESPARIAIRGADFQAMHTDQISLVVSPDLDIRIGGRDVDVRGRVNVPRATIEILEVPQAAVSPSSDVVYVGATEEQAPPPLDVTAEVTLALGENVVFRGFGFNTHLDGTVVAVDQPGQVTQGRGELVLREGIYRGYGQNLAVDPGRLIFAGPIDDPSVDVRAYRQATDGTRAGFLVGGTLKSLDVDVWSDPAKTDSDALSYILFGRSMSQGTEADQIQAGSAAAIIGGNMLAMSMASKIGLDEARIETGARQQETAFYAGKYLSPKLYVAYGVGLYEPINVLRVRYLISRKFTLQAETGTRDSGDILYRIEF